MDSVFNQTERITDQVTATLLKKVFNIMRKHTRIDLDPYFRTPANNDKWMGYIKRTLFDLDDPFFLTKCSNNKIEQNTLDKHPFWGLKKSSFAI